MGTPMKATVFRERCVKTCKIGLSQAEGIPRERAVPAAESDHIGLGGALRDDALYFMHIQIFKQTLRSPLCTI